MNQPDRENWQEGIASSVAGGDNKAQSSSIHYWRGYLLNRSNFSCSLTGLEWLKRRGVAELIVCAIAFLAFVQTLGFQFVYDDQRMVVENDLIRSWQHLPRYFTANVLLQMDFSVNFYRPLWLAWLRLNYALFGLVPSLWHLALVLLHVLVTYLVFATVKRITDGRAVALTAAVLFALHPVHVESVAWISGVTDVLCTAFLLSSLLTYLRGEASSRRGAWILASCTMFGLALFTKELAITFTALLFLYELSSVSVPREFRARLGRAAVRITPFLVIAVGYLVLRAHVMKHVAPAGQEGWATVALTVPSVVWLYVQHLLLPTGLSEFYGMPWVRDISLKQFFVPVVLVAAFAVAAFWAVRSIRQKRVATFACAWMAITLAPSLYLKVFSPGDIAHDRFLYLPSIGFAMLIALIIESVAERWRAYRYNITVAVVSLVGILYLFGTTTQQMYWATNIILYNRGMQIAPNDSKAVGNFASELAVAGHVGKAIYLYHEVLSRDPNNAFANYNLGLTYYRIARLTDAEMYLQRAVTIDPHSANGFLYLGLTQLALEHVEEAERSIQRALQLAPRRIDFHLSMAKIRIRQNNYPAAESELLKELEYHPENVDFVQEQLKIAREKMQ